MQRYIERTLKKDDVIYTSQAHGDHWQSTVRLACNTGEEYVGELCGSEKEAQQSAATQVLAAFSAEIAALPPKTKGKAQDGLAAPGVTAVMGPAGQAANYKTELVQKMQQHCKRAMTKGDILYEVARIGEQFQATVKLNCTGGQEFTGEVSLTEKLAEQAAAQQALINCNMWLPGTTPAPAVEGVKRKAPDPSSINPKSELVTFLQRLLKRTLVKGDVLYEQAATEGGVQVTVTLACYQSRQFAGEVCPAQKMAEASAAGQALGALAAELGQPAPLAKKPKTAAAAPARAAGAFMAMRQPAPAWPVPGWTGGPRVVAPAQRPGGAAQSEVRQLAVEETLTGEVVDWNETGGFGWIRPDMVINHPLASQRQGKIYVHKKDVVSGNPLGTGSMVQFRAYSDSKGLGACEVIPF